jgi:non-heme chloroperoxidase
VLVAPLLPFLLKTGDSPDGMDRSVFDGLAARIAADRPAAMKDFLDRSYNIDLLGGSRVSDQAWQNSFYVAVSASAHAALGCVTACLEDFRGDLATISIPVLVIHGDQDRVLPYEASSSGPDEAPGPTSMIRCASCRQPAAFPAGKCSKPADTPPPRSRRRLRPCEVTRHRTSAASWGRLRTCRTKG